MKYIYGLVDPRNRQICYVGQTDNVNRRYTQHLSDDARTAKAAWLAELKNSSLKPDIIILQQCENDSDVNHFENWWIFLGRQQGWMLTNGTNPGEWRFKSDSPLISNERLRNMESAHWKEVERRCDEYIEETKRIGRNYLEGIKRIGDEHLAWARQASDKYFEIAKSIDSTPYVEQKEQEYTGWWEKFLFSVGRVIGKGRK